MTPLKQARSQKISPQEADRITEELRASDKSDEAIARVADAHKLSSLTIRKIAAVRGVAR